MTARGRDTLGWVLLALLVGGLGYRAWNRRADAPVQPASEEAEGRANSNSPATAPPPPGARPAREDPPRLGSPPRPAAFRERSPSDAPRDPDPERPAGPPPAIFGVVTTDDWFRVPGATVLLTTERPGREGERVHAPSRVVSRTRTDEDGRFAFDGAPQGTLYVLVRGATHPEGGSLSDAWVAARAGPEEVTIRVPGAPACWVRVVDSEGNPVTGAQVRLSPPHGTWVPASSDEDGWARVALARPGDPAEYRLSVAPPRDRVDLDAVTDRPWEREIVMGHGATVSGTVEDAHGRPVAGALVTARDADLAMPRVVETSSTADGRFQFGGWRGSAALVSARPAAAPALAGEWPVARVAVGTADVRIALPPVADLPVLVEGIEGPVFVALRRQVDVGGRPPDGWRALAFPSPEPVGGPATEPWAVRTTDDAGRVRFPAVPSDRPWVLWMLPDGDQRTFVRSDARADGREIRVRAETGRPTRVRVDAGPDVRIWIARAVDAHGAVYDLERDDRAYRFPALPSGTWHVVAQVARSRRPWDLRGDSLADLESSLRRPRREDPAPEGPDLIQEYVEADVVAGAEVVFVPGIR